MILNPYNPLEPVDDPALFFGQEAAFAFFRQNLVGAAHHHALVLIGRRGLGKSSVARQLRYQVDDRYRVAVISLGTYEISSEEALIAGWIEDIRLSLDQAEVSTYRLPEWPEDEEASLRDWFDTVYLDIALTALRHRHLLLVIDDAHLMLQAIQRGALPADWLHYLAGLLEHHSRLDLVFTLDAAFEDQTLTTELMNDPALHFRLAELSLADAERIIREPMDQACCLYEEGTIRQILDWAGGHPFLLHSVCRLLFRRAEERNLSGPVTEHDLIAVYPAVLEQADEIFRPLWDSASQNERLVLGALVDLNETSTLETILQWLTVRGYTLNKTQVASALRGLDYKGLIQAQPDGLYAVPADLIVGWIRVNSDPPPVTRPPRRVESGRLAAIIGLVAVLLVVGGLGAAVLFGVFDAGGEDHSTPAIQPTATLSLNMEATRQSVFATQTEQARPTATPTITATPSPTHTPTITPTETATQRPTLTRTPRPSVTPTEILPSDTPAAPPTNTPRPSASPTLDPDM